MKRRTGNVGLSGGVLLLFCKAFFFGTFTLLKGAPNLRAPRGEDELFVAASMAAVVVAEVEGASPVCIRSLMLESMEACTQPIESKWNMLC